jgi:hypothetical protein
MQGLKFNCMCKIKLTYTVLVLKEVSLRNSVHKQYHVRILSQIFYYLHYLAS